MRSPFIHEARLQKRTDGKVHCLTCERCCLLADEEEISQLRDEIRERWKQLPPEHQARTLLDLLEILPEGDWPAQFHLLQKEPMTLLEKELVVNPSITFERLE